VKFSGPQSTSSCGSLFGGELRAGFLDTTGAIFSLQSYFAWLHYEWQVAAFGLPFAGLRLLSA